MATYKSKFMGALGRSGKVRWGKESGHKGKERGNGREIRKEKGRERDTEVKDKGRGGSPTTRPCDGGCTPSSLPTCNK